MKTITGMSSDLYNKYRFDFCEFVNQNPNLFSQLMSQMLIIYNSKYTNTYQNYIGSKVYEESKYSLYEMVFRAYARIRLENELKFRNLFDNEIDLKKFLNLLKTKFVDNITGVGKISFRKEREYAFLRISAISFGIKTREHSELTELVGKNLEKFTPSNDKVMWNIFNKLSSEKKEQIFEKNRFEAIELLESNNPNFNGNKSVEALEN